MSIQYVAEAGFSKAFKILTAAPQVAAFSDQAITVRAEDTAPQVVVVNGGESDPAGGPSTVKINAFFDDGLADLDISPDAFKLHSELNTLVPAISAVDVNNDGVQGGVVDLTLDDFGVGDLLTDPSLSLSYHPPAEGFLRSNTARLVGAALPEMVPASMRVADAAFTVGETAIAVNLSAATTYAAIATAVQAALRAATDTRLDNAVFTFDTDHFVLALPHDTTVSAFGAPDSGTDISASLGMTEPSRVVEAVAQFSKSVAISKRRDAAEASAPKVVSAIAKGLRLFLVFDQFIDYRQGDNHTGIGTSFTYSDSETTDDISTSGSLVALTRTVVFPENSMVSYAVPATDFLHAFCDVYTAGSKYSLPRRYQAEVGELPDCLMLQDPSGETLHLHFSDDSEIEIAYDNNNAQRGIILPFRNVKALGVNNTVTDVYALWY